MGGDLTPLDKRVRLRVYRHFVETGATPTPGDVAAALGISVEAARESLQRLNAAHALLLLPDGEAVRMAWPFSGVETPYRVRHADGRSWFANCAWDMLGIPAMLGLDAALEAPCAQTGERIVMQARGGSLSEARGVIHFLVPFSQWYDDVIHT